MARFETFARDIMVATEGLSDAEISKSLASFARAELAKSIQSGEGSKRYARFVNGREGAAEESVRAPGPIVYEFMRWDEVLTFALIELVKRSPKKSGRYSQSFVVAARGRIVKSYDDIDANTEVVVFNAQPYSRRIEVGSMNFSVPPGHFEMATSALRRKFGANQGFRFETKFIKVAAGLHPLVPYVLRRGRKPGTPLTYPAIVINMVQ